MSASVFIVTHLEGSGARQLDTGKGWKLMLRGRGPGSVVLLRARGCGWWAAQVIHWSLWLEKKDLGSRVVGATSSSAAQDQGQCWRGVEGTLGAGWWAALRSPTGGLWLEKKEEEGLGDAEVKYT